MLDEVKCVSTNGLAIPDSMLAILLAILASIRDEPDLAGSAEVDGIEVMLGVPWGRGAQASAGIRTHFYILDFTTTTTCWNRQL